MVLTGNSHLDLSKATLDLVSGNGTEQRVSLYSGSKVMADQSTIDAKQVTITNASSIMDIVDTTLTTESLAVHDGGIFTAEDSDVRVTGNTTDIGAGGQMFINGGSYEEAGNFTIDGGTLKADDVAMKIKGDMSISGTSIVEVGQLFIGDDFSIDITGEGFFSSTMITMMGTMDNEGDGHLFDLTTDILLDGLSIADSVDIVLMGDLMVETLIFSGLGSIDLNGYSLGVSSSFVGGRQQIFGTGAFNYDPGQSVPEPSTFLLMGLGLILVLRNRDRIGV